MELEKEYNRIFNNFASAEDLMKAKSETDDQTTAQNVQAPAFMLFKLCDLG